MGLVSLLEIGRTVVSERASGELAQRYNKYGKGESGPEGSI